MGKRALQYFLNIISCNTLSLSVNLARGVVNVFTLSRQLPCLLHSPKDTPPFVDIPLNLPTVRLYLFMTIVSVRLRDD